MKYSQIIPNLFCQSGLAAFWNLTASYVTLIHSCYERLYTQTLLCEWVKQPLQSQSSAKSALNSILNHLCSTLCNGTFHKAALLRLKVTVALENVQGMKEKTKKVTEVQIISISDHVISSNSVRGSNFNVWIMMLKDYMYIKSQKGFT